MVNYGVYQIELDGKRYIGSTGKDFNKRWNSHLINLRKGIHPNHHLQNAFNKYGENSLKFSILEIVETPKETIIIEQKFIDGLRPEYNMCPTAGSLLGYKHSDKAKQNMSNARKGKQHSEETKEKIRIAKSNHSEETKQKMSLAHKGIPLSEVHKQKLIESMQSETTRTKMSNAHKGHKLTEEHKRKISITLKGLREKSFSIKTSEY